MEEKCMRLTASTVFSIVLAVGLAVLPLGGIARAAPGSGTPAARTHQGVPKIGLTVESVSQVLGITPATLQQDLQSVQTILQIAGGKYSSAQELATALLANLKTKL